MSDNTSIEWTDATWNVVTGCTKVSPGCDNCYAETFAERWRGTTGHHFENGFDLTIRPERLTLPLKWRKPRKVFVNSMSDLFHKDITDECIARVFAVMAATPQHTYQILTKRHARMRSLLKDDEFRVEAKDAYAQLHFDRLIPGRPLVINAWPPRNVWLGVSVENQHWADIRIPALLDTPAAVRWISAEPLLGPVDLDQPRCEDHDRREVTEDDNGREWCGDCAADGFSGELSFGHWLDPLNGGIQWVVTGGESGPKARPADPNWFRSIRDQCQTADVAYLHKQNGEWAPNGKVGIGCTDPREYLVGKPDNRGFREVIRRVGKKAAGRELDGVTHDGFPQPAEVAP